MAGIATVLHSIDTGGPGGAETVFLTLTAAGHQTGTRSVAVAKGGGWVENKLRQSAVKSYFVDPAGAFNWPYLRSLIRIIRENDVKLVCSHLFGSNLYCAIATSICRIPLVGVFHGAHDLTGLHRLGTIKRSIVEHGCNAIIAVSDDLREELIASGFRNSDSLHTIYNGVDTARFNPQRDTRFRDRLSITHKNILIGAIGNIRAAKSYEVFIDAAKFLSQMSDQYRFLIAGQGDNELQQKLRDRVARNGLENTFHFTGFVDEPELLYNNLDVYVSSSSSEGFSISCIEALACGVPVVATRSGGPEEIIEDRKSGRLVDIEDPKSLASAISELGDDDRAREAYIERGIARVSEKFSDKNMLAQYSILFDSLTNDSKY